MLCGHGVVVGVLMMTGWTERERAREHEHQHMRVGGVTHASSHQAMRSACRTWAPSCACYRCISAPFKVLFGLHFGVTCESTWVLNPLFSPTLTGEHSLVF